MKQNRGKAKQLIIQQIEDYERQIFDLHQLVEISKSLTSTLKHDTLIETILFTCLGQMRTTAAGVFLRKGLDDPTLLLNRNSIGFDFPPSESMTIAGEHRIIGLAQHDTRCITLDELRVALGSLDGLECLVRLAPGLVVPLVARGMVYGFIVLGSRLDGEHYDQRDREYIMDVAVLAAIAIHNSTLFEMTTTDRMTHLRLNHFLITSIITEMEYAKESRQPLSLIMMDLDHFKMLNDNHGHLAGDEVLKAVAETVLAKVRQQDVAARYGGEEFAILLPATPMPIAHKIAHRLLTSIRKLRVPYGDTALQVTVSIGLTSLHHDTDHGYRDLLGRADVALYKAKEGGRNRIVELV